MLFTTPTSQTVSTAAVTQTHPVLQRGSALKCRGGNQMWHGAGESLHSHFWWNREAHSAGEKRSQEQFMYFILLHPLDAVKPDDRHPEFTSQLPNTWHNSGGQRWHQKQSKTTNTQQPHRAMWKPTWLTSCLTVGTCEALQGFKQQGRHRIVLAFILLSSRKEPRMSY